MRYLIDKSHYRDFDTISINRLEHRSYFIPFRTAAAMEASDYLTERYRSDAVLLLSGTWDFAYFRSGARLGRIIDTDAMAFDTVHVPSTWQKTGYDKINYLNAMYPFRCNPPKTPRNCPVGVYRKKFQLHKRAGHHYIITFLGAAASLDVYLNGSFTGYSEGSHNSHEFDLTDALCDGENELVVVVYKWSTGTYLECQDMFRENGIFRDVYITEQPPCRIFDFRFEAGRGRAGYDAQLTADIRGDGGDKKLRAQLTLGVVSVAEAVAGVGEPVQWADLDVREWSAERPVCYDLTLTLLDGGRPVEYVRHRVGFRTIELDGCRYLFNGRPVKFKGVNHHDTHPVRGYAMTAEDLKRDVELMKAYNVNCVRTSHYPPDPILMALCDAYGLYVVDEADIETHGCFVKNIDLISDDPKWESHYLDRIGALYERDKNHVSVAMWSMGNEAGGIRNFDACYAYLKSRTGIPVHYEPACRSQRVRYDILAHFYTPPEEMRALSRGEWKDPRNYDAPFFLCEYAHSMGVGPGALDEYWDIIYSDERFLGGCIWEWEDHAHFDPNAKYRYTYGGDHGDRLNSGNFCCDGLFFPDRTPSPSALCMKNVYSPLRAYKKDGAIYVRNHNYFVSGGEVEIDWHFVRDGKTCGGESRRVEIQPGECLKLPVKPAFSDGEDVFLILRYTSVSDGRVIAREQIVLNEAFPSAAVRRSDLTWGGDRRSRWIGQGGRRIRWDAAGTLVEWTDRRGNQLLDPEKPGFAVNLYQAVIDNHVYAVAPLKKLGIDRLIPRRRRMAWDGYLNTVQTSVDLCAGGKKRFRAEIVHRAVSDREIYVSFALTSLCRRPVDLLQIGLTLALDGRYHKVRYYGMGETESYSDFSAQDVMGIYETDTAAMDVGYIKPQESGSRSGVRWAEVTDESGSGLRITALEQPLNFKATDIDPQELRRAKHREDVVRLNKTILHLNGFMRGIGSASCGPDTAERYQKILHYRETYTYSFKIESI